MLSNERNNGDGGEEDSKGRRRLYYTVIDVEARLRAGQSGIRIPAVVIFASPKCPNQHWDPSSLVLNA